MVASDMSQWQLNVIFTVFGIKLCLLSQKVGSLPLCHHGGPLIENDFKRSDLLQALSLTFLCHAFIRNIFSIKHILKELFINVEVLIEPLAVISFLLNINFEEETSSMELEL